MTITDEMVKRAFLLLLKHGIVADCEADRESVRAALDAALEGYRLQSAPKIYRTDEPPEDVRD